MVTFHVDGKAPAFPHDLKPLFPTEPDVAVIALQEVVKSGVGMKIGNLLKNTSTSDQLPVWESYLLTVLNSQIEDSDEQYVFY